MNPRGLAYRAAMNAAMDDLDRICRESEHLKIRLHQLDAAAEALKPFMDRREPRIESSHTVDESIEMNLKLSQLSESAIQMVGSALPEIVPTNLIQPEEPIRRRINSVLGLAVA